VYEVRGIQPTAVLWRENKHEKSSNPVSKYLTNFDFFFKKNNFGMTFAVCMRRAK